MGRDERGPVTDVQLRVQNDAEGIKFSFVAEGAVTALATALLVVVNDNGEMLWVIGGRTDVATAKGLPCVVGETRYGRVRLTRVTYGQVPPGFEQLYPDAAPAKELTRGEHLVFCEGLNTGRNRFTVP
jgi:hypothetical protein